MSRNKGIIPGHLPFFFGADEHFRDPRSFGALLQHVRLTQRLSQTELAEGICSRQVIEDLERGKLLQPSLQLVVSLFERLQEQYLANQTLDRKSKSEERLEKETALFHATPREVLNQILMWKRHGQFSAYAFAIGTAYYYSSIGLFEESEGPRDEYLASIRLQLNRFNQAMLEAVKNPAQEIPLASFATKIQELTRQFMAYSWCLRTDEQIQVCLILANTLLLYRYSAVVSLVIAKTLALVSQSSVTAMEAEFHFNYAGYLTRNFSFHDALKALERAEVIFNACRLNRLHELDFFKAVVRKLMLMHEAEVFYTIADCHEVIKALWAQYMTATA